MAVYRTNPESKGNVGLKFIESLLKNKFSMCLTDSEGQTPMGYLLVQSIPETAISAVVQLAVRYGFDMLSSVRIGADGTNSNTFMMEVLAMGKMTFKLF